VKRLALLTLAVSFSALAAADADEKPALPESARPPLEITEIYADPSGAQKPAEFLEVFHGGNSPLDLSGWRFTKGIKLTFPPGFVLPAGAFAVLCFNLFAATGIRARGK
jgi:hypothetical protein